MNRCLEASGGDPVRPKGVEGRKVRNALMQILKKCIDTNTETRFDAQIKNASVEKCKHASSHNDERQAGGVDGEEGGEEVHAEEIDEEQENGQRNVVKVHQPGCRRTPKGRSMP